ncbi:hypothetical protein CN938_30850 [Bacillus thuringiensis]|nr:hypothetical protein CN283_30330 [Bacillus thuringiensis]PGM02619.1 hypothetical protein CN938_30850 [Bacillus thuringiensis]PGN31365.1 hypothetical protein CN968_29635 [Bacillus thuringiensis]
MASFFYKKPPSIHTLEGVPAAFRKKTTLRAYKILYSFSANPVTNENPKTRATIEMYKKIYRMIEKEKDGFLVRVRVHLFPCYRK